MTIYSAYTDQELLVFLKQGNELAYTEIYKRYWALLYRNARKMLRSDEDASDTVQEIFTNLWEKAPDLYQGHTLSSYLYSAVRNKIINQVNRHKLKVNYLNSLQAYLDKGTCITDDMVRERELKISIEKEISMLPEKMRLIFELSRKANLSYKEIAAQINVSEGTVKKQIYNAIKALRTKLGSYFFFI